MDLRTLFETDWYDKSPLPAVLRRNHGRWIHFSGGAPNRDIQKVPLLPEPERPTDYREMPKYRRAVAKVRRKNAVYPVPKLGINPRSMWQDPKGIYFYPVDFLLSSFERTRIGQQYGLDRPYYYIADLNLNDPHGVNLGTMTWPEVEAIAKRNGWYEMMEEFRQLSPEEQQKKLFSYARPAMPGSFFWHFIDRMVKDGKITWNKAYRGVSYIRDPNMAIIHNNEPDQVLVLDPRLIKNVEFGENKNPIKFSEADKLQHWWHTLMSIIKRIRGEYGGDLAWMHKKPTLTFTHGIGRFELTVTSRSNTMQPGLDLTMTYGRAYDSMHVDVTMLRDKSVDAIVHTLSQKIDQIARRKTDLTFTPIITIDTGKRLMINQMADHLGLSISTTIYNSQERRYNSISLHGETQRERDRVKVKTTCYLSLTPDRISASCNVWAGAQYLISAQSDYQQEFTEVEPMLASVAAKVRENFDNMANSYAPRTDARMWRPRFHTNAEFVAFKGWVALNCGLSLNGALTELFADDIAAYRAYPDPDNLVREIAHVLNSKY